MPTTLATPTYALGPLTFNATDGNGVTWGVKSTSGWYDGPPPRLNQVPFPRVDGVYRAASYRGARTITLTGWAEAPSRQAAQHARDQLQGLFVNGTQQVLTVTDDFQTRTATVELSDTKATPAGLGLSFDWQLVLVAADPRKYDAVTQQQSAALPTASSGLDWSTGGGLDWATGGGLNWGIAGSNGLLTVTNSGSADAWPTFTFAAPTDPGVWLYNASVTNANTGQVISVAGFLNSGDVLVVNTSPYNRSVMLNGSTDRRAMLPVAQWFPIPAGQSVTLQFGGTSTSTQSLLTVTWANAWW